MLDELPPPPAKLRCKICHLSISVAELDGGSCPECEESRGERNEDFEPIEDAPPGGTRYRCDDCGLIVDVPVSAPRASSPG